MRRRNEAQITLRPEFKIEVVSLPSFRARDIKSFTIFNLVVQSLEWSREGRRMVLDKVNKGTFIREESWVSFRWEREEVIVEVIKEVEIEVGEGEGGIEEEG